MSVYADVIRYRELFGSLFRRDLRAKYRGSFLGLAWSLLHPLVLMGVYLLVFSVLWKVAEVGSDDYWLFLLCGLPAWVFFATAAQAASRSLHCQRSRRACRSSTERSPSSAKSSAARANAYTAATCGRMRRGSRSDATGKFS